MSSALHNRFRLLGWSMATVVLAGTGIFVVAIVTADPNASHRAGHIGCPPGSHGKPWSADAGRKLRQALNSRDQVNDNVRASPLADRALTAQIRQP